MKIRKLTSLTLTIAALVVFATGIGMAFFSVPSKHYFKYTHEIFGIVMVVSGLLHMGYNWKTLVNYLKSPRKKFHFSKELALSCVLAAALTMAVVNNPPPGNTAAGYPAIENIDLRVVLEAEGIDYAEAIDALYEAGFNVPEGDLTLRMLSSANQKNPRVIYSVLANAKPETLQITGAPHL